MKLCAILIDDERKSLAILKNKLERMCPQVEVIAETQEPLQGLELIESLKPQLVFLDIAMPEMSGFDLLAEIEEPDFEIIFVTAFDNYAIDAINHCAIGYLVKPVDNEDLKNTVEKAIINIEQTTALKKNNLLLENLRNNTFQGKKIVIPTNEGLEIVSVVDVIHCEGVDGYTNLYFIDEKPILSSHSIGYFYKLLMEQGFYLVHKSHLVNLNHIKKYLKEGSLILTDGKEIPVSQKRRNDFLKILRNK
jgi:two-component system LytT family response regulator